MLEHLTTLSYTFPDNFFPLLLLKSISDNDDWRMLKTAIIRLQVLSFMENLFFNLVFSQFGDSFIFCFESSDTEANKSVVLSIKILSPESWCIENHNGCYMCVLF